MIKQFIEQLFSQAFKAAFDNLEDHFKAEVTQSTQTQFGHYQCNSAMKLTKVLQKSPRDIANAVVNLLNTKTEFKLAVAGPGFINIALTQDYINQQTQHLNQDKSFGIKKSTPLRVVMDFSSPNVAKEMHVGHLRSTIIGDSIARILEFLGHDVLRLNHIGDWGTAFGMLIAYLGKENPTWWQDPTINLTYLMTAYKASKRLFDESPEFKKQAQLAVVSLQGGDVSALNQWQRICEISRKSYEEIYALLDIKLIERGESFYNPWLKEVVDDVTKKGLVEESDGAKCLFLPGFTNREGQPLPFILQKSDGGYNYATTDMASIRHRINEEKAQWLIYVTDAGQASHFAMLFAAAKMAGYLPENVRFDHVTFGLVLGADNKKFKTRSGETEPLIDLLQAAIDKAQELLAERQQNNQHAIEETDLNHIAMALGINAIKYADLSGNRTQDYVFSYDRMLKFEGNTAAFLMYSYVRIQGIKRKITNGKLEAINLQHESELTLALHLCQFSEMMHEIVQDLLPHRLCDYLYHLAEKFNAFFRDCRVEGVSEQGSRLALCELSARVLKAGLELLGLRVVERM